MTHLIETCSVIKKIVVWTVECMYHYQTLACAHSELINSEI
jgi:hypothetical protein